MRRTVQPEVIDDPSTPMKELEHLLGCVRVTNSRLGGTAMLLDCLKAWSPRWPRDRAITLLDIGTGSADVPLAAVAWARANGYDLRATGIDTNERTLDVARRLCANEPSVNLIHLDAMRLLDEADSPFAAASFDYVHAGMFLHHLDEPLVPRMLSVMVRLSLAGFVWNDLIRSRRGYAVAWLATIGQAIRHDCLASLHAGFTESEVLAYANDLGLSYARYSERFRCQRFSLAGEKPDAWTNRAPAQNTLAGVTG